MEILSTIFLLMSLTILSLFLILSFLIIRIFTGKSINDPNYAPVKGSVLNQLLYFSHIYDYQTQIAKKLPTFRLLDIAHSVIFTADTRNIEHILKTNFNKYEKGTHHQELVRDLWGQGIFAVDGQKWRQQRKLASYEFSTRVLRDFSCSVFRIYAAKLVRAVSELTASRQVIEFQDLLMKYTMESMFKVGFGIDLNCMEGSSEEGTTFVKAFDDANESLRLRYFNTFWKLKRALNIGSEASLKKNIKVIDNFIHNVLSAKKKLLAMNPNPNVKEDILSRFLMESEKNPETMTDQYLRDIILNFLLAGKDTAANALSWFFYMLCKHPLVQEKVAQEVIDIACSKGNDASVDDFITTITDATLEKMHYLHAALTETLRLYPPVRRDGRCSQADDILPDGHKVKKGDMVAYLAYPMGRMPSIWGEDAEVFRPERWLKDGVFQPESPFKFVAFHAGPRVCLGKEFAYRQMKIFSIALARYFCFKIS
ncbi:cytochrome P450 704C1-like [Herrania umbratica]|uniref:Cytochrome P450 704C1-like n=1 Tax=Herrania umbratica TaxID=108875 RepID=A0A6J0ZXS1_9ROSI|nr:cytochrome P450 704C1-like [Herrania umbratica]